MQNGTFEEGTDHWRLLGNHGQHGLSQVVADPDDPQNQRAAPGGHREPPSTCTITRKPRWPTGRRIQSSKTYQISFRAKWLAGSPQLNSRLYFNRLPDTTILPITTRTGTPGRAEQPATSQHRANLRRSAPRAGRAGAGGSRDRLRCRCRSRLRSPTFVSGTRWRGKPGSPWRCSRRPRIAMSEPFRDKPSSKLCSSTWKLRTAGVPISHFPAAGPGVARSLQGKRPSRNDRAAPQLPHHHDR